jgi:glycosyltransferase involved in cell wall biosynthesis
MRERKGTARVFMTWVPSSSRTDLLCDAFTAQPYYVRYFPKKTLFQTLLRYFFAAFQTILYLSRSKPSIIFVMNQPVFLPMIVFIYSRITKARYVLDSHSGLFNKKRWRAFTPIMKQIYRACWLNIAHNEHDAAKYRLWGAKTVVVGTEVYPYDSYEKIDLETKDNVVVIGNYAADEPTEEVLAAGTALGNVHFYFTGEIERAKRKIDLNKLPANITLTDFVPRKQFIGLVKAADVALVLVKTENTMQMGAWEAMSCNTPVILSDWSLLRATFSKGAIFVRNTPESIQEGVKTFFSNRDALKRDIARLKREKNALWKNEINTVEAILDSRE